MILNIEYVDIDDLKHYDKNSKIHTREQIKHIANSIKRFGFNDPIGIAGQDNIILEGNGRISVCITKVDGFVIFVLSFVYDTLGGKWSKIGATAKWTTSEAKDKLNELKDMEQKFPER